MPQRVLSRDETKPTDEPLDQPGIEVPEDDAREVAVQATAFRSDPLDLVVDVKIVYLGSNPHKSVILQGGIDRRLDPRPKAQAAGEKLRAQMAPLHEKETLTKAERQHLDELQVQLDAVEKMHVPSGDTEAATYYDFSRYDKDGRPNHPRLTGDKHIFARCTHIGHVIQFMQERDADGGQMFEVRANPADSAKIQRYARLVAERTARLRVVNRDDDVLLAKLAH